MGAKRIIPSNGSSGFPILSTTWSLDSESWHSDDHIMGMDQYLLIPFLGGWTSIYQLFWCSPGVQGFDTLPYPHMSPCVHIHHPPAFRRGPSAESPPPPQRNVLRCRTWRVAWNDWGSIWGWLLPTIHGKFLVGFRGNVADLFGLISCEHLEVLP